MWFLEFGQDDMQAKFPEIMKEALKELGIESVDLQEVNLWNLLFIYREYQKTRDFPISLFHYAFFII